MFKKSGKGFKRPYCINPSCEYFVPEEKRGYVRKKAEAAETAEEKPAGETLAAEKGAKKTVEKKTAAKKTIARKAAAKKTVKKEK